VVTSAVLFQETTDVVMKLEPFTVNTESALPGATDAGDTPFMFGTGLLAASAFPGQRTIHVASKKAIALPRR